MAQLRSEGRGYSSDFQEQDEARQSQKKSDQTLPPPCRPFTDPVYTGPEWKGMNLIDFDYFTRQQLIFSECLQVTAHRYHPPLGCGLSANHGLSQDDQCVLSHYRLMRTVIQARTQLTADDRRHCINNHTDH